MILTITNHSFFINYSYIKSSYSLSILRYLPKENPATNVDDKSNFSLGRAAESGCE